jgi:hypothetical protein
MTATQIILVLYRIRPVRSSLCCVSGLPSPKVTNVTYAHISEPLPSVSSVLLFETCAGCSASHPEQRRLLGNQLSHCDTIWQVYSVSTFMKNTGRYQISPPQIKNSNLYKPHFHIITTKQLQTLRRWYWRVWPSSLIFLSKAASSSTTSGCPAAMAVKNRLFVGWDEVLTKGPKVDSHNSLSLLSEFN